MEKPGDGGSVPAGVFPQGKGHGNAGNEDENGEYQVVQVQSFPAGMRHLACGFLKKSAFRISGSQEQNQGVQAQDNEHVQPAQGVQGVQAGRTGGGGRGIGHLKASYGKKRSFYQDSSKHEGTEGNRA